MKEIYLIIKKEYLQKIINNEKKIEYREIKPFYIKKFENISIPFIIKFQAGYNKNALSKNVIINKVKKDIKNSMYELYIEKILD